MRAAVLVGRDADWALRLARHWVDAGEDVTVVLVGAATALARAGHEAGGRLREAVAAGASVLAVDAALRRRAMDAAELEEGVKVADLDEVADLLADGVDKAVWL